VSEAHPAAVDSGARLQHPAFRDADSHTADRGRSDPGLVLTTNPLLDRARAARVTGKLNPPSALGSVAALDAITVQQCPLPQDTLLAPILSDYRPRAWYTKFLDLTLLAVLAVTEALLTRPATLPLVAARALLVCVPSLGMVVFVFWVRPFPRAAGWKTWVRIGLLSVGVVCALTNAEASAIQLAGPDVRLEEAVVVLSFLLFGGICVVAVVLVGGFFVTLISTARKEQQQLDSATPAMTEKRLSNSARGGTSMTDNPLSSISSVAACSPSSVRGRGSFATLGIPRESVPSAPSQTVTAAQPPRIGPHGGSARIQHQLLREQQQRFAFSRLLRSQASVAALFANHESRATETDLAP
jgi:hypothetical protein